MAYSVYERVEAIKADLDNLDIEHNREIRALGEKIAELEKEKSWLEEELAATLGGG